MNGGDMESQKNEGERLPVEGTSDLSARLGALKEALDVAAEYVRLLENCTDGYYRATQTDLSKKYDSVMQALGYDA
jgi:hypothetical protein